MKKYRLKRWVKVTLTMLLMTHIFYEAFKVTPEDIERINYCVAQGYSEESCIKDYFG